MFGDDRSTPYAAVGEMFRLIHDELAKLKKKPEAEPEPLIEQQERQIPARPQIRLEVKPEC
jgi:hypothetical protein